jgi:Ribosomal protein L23
MLNKVLKLRNITERTLGKTRPVVKFYNKDLFLVRSGKERPDNTICFTAKTEITKPEISQVLTKLYNLDVKKVNTWIKQGKIQKVDNKTSTRKQDIKRVIVELNTTAPNDLQSFS